MPPERQEAKSYADPNAAAPEGSEGFYFSSPGLRHRLELLRHLVEHGEGVILVVGERLSGKAVLRERLVWAASDTWRVVQVHAHPMLDPRSVLHDLAAGLDATPRGTDRKSCLEAIEGAVVLCRDQGLVPILFVDSAHELSAESLKLLFALAQPRASRMPVRVVLFCEPHIHTILDAPELRPLQAYLGHVVDLPRLSLGETRAYLEARLTHIGLGGLLPIPEAAVERIHRESKGLPGRINEIASQSLDPGDTSGSRGGDRLAGATAALKHRWRLYTCAALLAAISLYVAIGPKREPAPELPDGEVPLQLPPAERLEPDISQAETSSQDLAGDRARVPQPSSAPHGVSKAPLPEASPQPQPVTPTAKPSDSPPPTQPPTVTSTTRPDPAPGQADPWLSAQRPDHYLVQLFASQNEAAAKRFLQQFRLPPRSRSVRSHRAGTTWHLVVYGPFPDRRAAVASLSSLSAELVAHKPWVRPISDLQPRGPARR